MIFTQQYLSTLVLGRGSGYYLNMETTQTENETSTVTYMDFETYDEYMEYVEEEQDLSTWTIGQGY